MRIAVLILVFMTTKAFACMPGFTYQFEFTTRSQCLVFVDYPESVELKPLEDTSLSVGFSFELTEETQSLVCPNGLTQVDSDNQRTCSVRVLKDPELSRLLINDLEVGKFGYLVSSRIDRAFDQVDRDRRERILSARRNENDSLNQRVITALGNISQRQISIDRLLVDTYSRYSNTMGYRIYNWYSRVEGVASDVDVALDLNERELARISNIRYEVEEILDGTQLISFQRNHREEARAKILMKFSTNFMEIMSDDEAGGEACIAVQHGRCVNGLDNVDFSKNYCFVYFSRRQDGRLDQPRQNIFSSNNQLQVMDASMVLRGNGNVETEIAGLIKPQNQDELADVSIQCGNPTRQVEVPRAGMVNGQYMALIDDESSLPLVEDLKEAFGDNLVHLRLEGLTE